MVQSNSVKLPAKHTLYWCTMLKLPEMPGKHHMIGYKPVISESNKRYVHHMMLYECHDEVKHKIASCSLFSLKCLKFRTFIALSSWQLAKKKVFTLPEEYLSVPIFLYNTDCICCLFQDNNSYERFHKHVNSGYECRSPNMPDDFRRCRGVVAAWGLGGEAFAFPEEAGYPVGEEHGGATYYMMEVHYDNPGQHSGIVDSSGLEILLTPNLRKYDSGLMTVGHDVSSLHLIPPGLEHYTTVGHCPDLCTSVNTFEGE